MASAGHCSMDAGSRPPGEITAAELLHSQLNESMESELRHMENTKLWGCHGDELTFDMEIGANEELASRGVLSPPGLPLATDFDCAFGDDLYVSPIPASVPETIPDDIFEYIATCPPRPEIRTDFPELPFSDNPVMVARSGEHVCETQRIEYPRLEAADRVAMPGEPIARDALLPDNLHNRTKVPHIKVVTGRQDDLCENLNSNKTELKTTEADFIMMPSVVNVNLPCEPKLLPKLTKCAITSEHVHTLTEPEIYGALTKKPEAELLNKYDLVVMQDLSGELITNNTENNEKELHCSKCSETFTKQQNFLLHMHRHATDKPYQCGGCGKACQLSKKLPVHVCGHSAAKGNIKERHNCIRCPKSFKSKYNLQLHMRIHTNSFSFKCTACDKAFTEKRFLQNHEKSHSTIKAFKCSICSKEFKNSYELKQHDIRHSEELYQCGVCNQEFLSNAKLEEHMKVHTVICGMCSKVFYEMALLKKHLAVHGGNGSLLCLFCGETFATNAKLIQHDALHVAKTTELFFDCRWCEETFTSHEDWKKHIGEHANQNLLPCGECGKKFPDKFKLTQHEKTHSSKRAFACDICGFSCKFKSSLKKHIRVHNREKPFTCTQCSKSFSQSGSLQRHLLVHAGIRAYKCDRCQRAFTEKYGLTLHQRKVHSQSEK